MLPVFTPVKSKIPDKYVGDVLALLEFVTSFSSVLGVKNFFPNGLTFELVEKALMEKEVCIL